MSAMTPLRLVLVLVLSLVVVRAPLLAQDDTPAAFTPAQLARVTTDAAEGDAVAQYALGYVYLYGYGAPTDYPRSTQWLRFAAAQGHAEAQYRLGLAYVLGRGIPEDPVQAHLWLNLAAARLSGARHDQARHMRTLVAQEMSVSQLRTARALAGAWTPAPWSQVQRRSTRP